MKNNQLIGLLISSILVGTGLLGSGVLLLNNQSLDSQLQDTTSDYEELLSEYEELNNSYNNLLGQYDVLLEVHDTLTSDYTSVTNQYNDAMDTLNKTIEDCKILNQTYNNLILEHESLNFTYYDLIIEYEILDQMHYTLTGEHYELNSTYYELINELYTLNSTYYELIDQHEQLNQTYYNLVADYDLLEVQNATMTTLYLELLQNHQTLQSDHDELLNNYNILQSDYDELFNNHDALQSDYQNLENEYSLLSGQYDELLQNYLILSQTYQQLQLTHQTLQQDYSDLWDSYNLLDQEYSQLSVDYGLLDSEYQNLNSSYYGLQDDYQLLNDIYTTLTTWIGQQILPVQYCLFAEAVRRYYEPLYLDGATTKEWFMGAAEFARDIVLHDSQQQYNVFSDISDAFADVLPSWCSSTPNLAYYIMQNVFGISGWLPNWSGMGLTGNNMTDIDTVHQWCVDTIDYEYDSDIDWGQEPEFWDYFKFPVETAFRTMGDCEDQAILDAAYLESCGFDTAIAIIHDPTHPIYGSFYHGTLLVSIEDTTAYWQQYPNGYLWIFSGDPDNNYWCWLDPTWDVPFGSTPAWLQNYIDIYGGIYYSDYSIAFCDVGGAVI